MKDVFVIKLGWDFYAFDTIDEASAAFKVLTKGTKVCPEYSGKRYYYPHSDAEFNLSKEIFVTKEELDSIKAAAAAAKEEVHDA